MIVSAIRTHVITTDDTSLFRIIDTYINELQEGSVLAVTSKIIAMIQGRVVSTEGVSKEELIAQEADYYIPAKKNRYNSVVSIKNGVLVGSAGIDASNGNGHYILWPNDPQQVANELRAYLYKRFQLTRVGVIITDSHSVPMQNGSIGCAIAHSGFMGIRRYKGKKDLFERELHVSKTNVPNALAAAAVAVMGEGDEQTPLAVINDAAFVDFVEHDPTEPELRELHMSMEEDMFHELLLHAPWKSRL